MLESRADHAACLHCGRESPPGLSFCCAGCESVHALLIQRGLGHFYDLRGQGQIAPPRPVDTSRPDTAAELLSPVDASARFFLEGIHCLGCLWLLEKLPEIDPRITKASLDFTHGILAITRGPGISWPEVSALIRSLGYTPRPLNEAADGEKARRAESARQAIRLGVAGFCSGNIMLLSVSLYAGANGVLARNFQLLSLILSLPTLFYSALPLYRSAWAPLRQGRTSVDLAISLALLSGFGLSVSNMVTGHGSETYFDSLSMLVFLLLSSRFLLSQFRYSLAKDATNLSFLSRERYRRLLPEAGEVTAESLDVGNRFAMRTGQTLPVDARLEQGPAHFDFSLLTGESEPVKLLRGDPVEAGARALTEGVELTVQRRASDSRLARILDQIRSYRIARSPSLDFADRIGRKFVLVVLALSALAIFILPFPEGAHRALVLVIVTCPCVLAFAVPLAFTRTLQQAARAGILFRGNDKLEELAGARIVFLDKTGTLTNGNFEVLNWEQLAGEDAVTRAAVLATELQSSHPVAKAVVRFLATTPRAAALPARVSEQPGVGITSLIGDTSWELRQLPVAGDPVNYVGVFQDGRPVARISLGDQLRADAAGFVAGLRKLGLEPMILSGDAAARVREVAEAVGITKWEAGLRPEDKAALVRGVPHSLMVGDGANDGVAFQAASVSIAVRGAVDLSLKNADVALTSPGLDGTLRAIRASRRAMRVVRTNFGISLVYNVIAGAGALAGGMSPLRAAALMPISAFSVFLFTQVATRGGPR